MSVRTRLRQWVVEQVLRLHWCRKCYALTWSGHRPFHEKWHEAKDVSVTWTQS